MPAAIGYQQSTNNFAQLCDIVARLRGPDGCPWDREQKNASLVSPLLEEAYEVAGAVHANDDVNLREELGDLLLLIVMHAQIASEEKRFDIDEIARGISEKLIRRHPHVFAVEAAVSAAQPDPKFVLKQWEAIKHAEKKDATHYLASLPKALPALMRAEKAQKKAARVNLNWRGLGEGGAKWDENLRETKRAGTWADIGWTADEIGACYLAVFTL